MSIPLFSEKILRLRRFPGRKSAFLFVHAMSKLYESVLLLSPSLSDEAVRSFFSEFQRDKIDSRGGKVTCTDFWGRRRLAYPISKNDTASYVVFRFELPSESLASLDEEMRLEKAILRHLTVVAEGEMLTAEKISQWNKEHLPQKESPKKSEEKRAPRRSRSEDLPLPPASSTSPKKEDLAEIDRRRLDVELDALLGD